MTVTFDGPQAPPVSVHVEGVSMPLGGGLTLDFTGSEPARQFEVRCRHPDPCWAGHLRAGCSVRVPAGIIIDEHVYTEVTIGAD